MGFQCISATICISEFQFEISGAADKWEMLMKCELIGVVFECGVVSDMSRINLCWVNRLGLWRGGGGNYFHSVHVIFCGCSAEGRLGELARKISYFQKQ